MKLIISAFTLSLIASAQAIVFSNMVPQTMNAATTSGQGGAHSPTFGTASAAVGTMSETDRILSINSITIHGLQSTGTGLLTIYVSGQDSWMYLHYGGIAGRAINGEVTFRAGTTAPTLYQAAVTGSGTLTGGTFTPQDKPVASGVPGRRDFGLFENTRTGWFFTLTNSNTTQASFTGISMDVNLAPVPEPASVFFLAGTLGAVIRKRRVS